MVQYCFQGTTACLLWEASHKHLRDQRASPTARLQPRKAVMRSIAFHAGEFSPPCKAACSTTTSDQLLRATMHTYCRTIHPCTANVADVVQRADRMTWTDLRAQ